MDFKKLNNRKKKTLLPFSPQMSQPRSTQAKSFCASQSSSSGSNASVNATLADITDRVLKGFG